MNEKNSSLELDVKKVEMRAQASVEEHERYRKIMESKMKAEAMFIESKYNLQLDTAQRQAESAQRNIISRIGVEFCSIFNTNEQAVLSQKFLFFF